MVFQLVMHKRGGLLVRLVILFGALWVLRLRRELFGLKTFNPKIKIPKKDLKSNLKK